MLNCLRSNYQRFLPEKFLRNTLQIPLLLSVPFYTIVALGFMNSLSYLQIFGKGKIELYITGFDLSITDIANRI